MSTAEVIRGPRHGLPWQHTVRYLKEGQQKCRAIPYRFTCNSFLNGGRCRLRARDGSAGPDGGIAAGTRPKSQFPCRAYQGVVGPHLHLRRRSKLPPSRFSLLPPAWCFSAWKPNPNRSPLVDDIHSLVAIQLFRLQHTTNTLRLLSATPSSIYCLCDQRQAHLASTARLFSGNSGTQHT